MEQSEGRLLARAVAIAAAAHQDQLDKAGAPYILHPLRLMMRAQSPAEQIVAVLHDVVEDSDWTLEQLAAEGFPDAILSALDCLTHRAGEEYAVTIARVLTHPLAVRVKLYDLEDNMTLTRLAEITEKDVERVRKYHQARQQLLAALESAAP